MEPRQPGAFFRGTPYRHSHENAKAIYLALKQAGIDFVVYLPDSWNYCIQKLVAEDPQLTSLSVTREDEGMAIAMGAYLGGKRPAMIMEASGYGLSALVLARPGLLQRMPLLIISSHTSALGEIHDYHGETRFVCEPLLQALGIPFILLTDIKEAGRVIREAQLTVEGQVIPVAVLLPRHLLWESEQPL